MGTFTLNHSGPGDVQPLQRFFELPPVETAALPVSTIQPLVSASDRGAEKAGTSTKPWSVTIPSVSFFIVDYLYFLRITSQFTGAQRSGASE